ncbi:metallophosphoesterase [Pseudomonas sp. ES3-33]|uniref:metallophosphoesterase n=1 Tax=Pseudomonas sp. ES3-33 TaxID=1628833 RepID=UPI0005D417B9|nr:metallophosphoesterase [Pseudomonas sp. ES3-33]KJH74014.1 hypothetical protein UB23_26535 [Pseudomonas sp. ES3-33]
MLITLQRTTLSLLIASQLTFGVMNVSANESSALAPSTAELVPPSAATALSAIAASGTYEHPKLWEEATTIGAIHKYTYEGKNFFFAAKFDGNASDHNWFFPTGPYSNDYWQFKGVHAGTYADPKELDEMTYIGAIHKRVINGGNLYFSSNHIGTTGELYFPTGPFSNVQYEFRGTRAGTYAEPKDWLEQTYVGAIHQYSEGDSSYFISKIDGLPEDGYRVYPTDKKSNANWTYAGTPSYIVMTSDPQYPWTDKKEDEKGNEKELSAAYIHAQYRDVNSFRSSHPALDIPVYVNGDITAFGHGDQLSFMKKRFKEYFNNKVYLGLGNHDYENNVNDCANNGCARDSVLTYLRMTKDLIARGNIDYRSSTGAGKFRESYAGSFAHSEWHNNLHVVQANNYPVYATKFETGVSHVNKKQFNINSSWNFIDNKMAFASNWGKVNILVTHKPNGWKNFSAADAEAFRAMMKKHKVAAVFAGHFHEDHGIYDNANYFGDTPVFLSGSASYETYLIVESLPEQKKLRVFSVRNNNHKAKTLLREIDY